MVKDDSLRQARHNQLTRDGWDQFGPHRRQVTKLLARACPTPPGRLAILGAGNCNDVDLKLLLDRCDELHLIDLDHEALKFGIGQQAVASCAQLRVHGNVDLRVIEPTVVGEQHPILDSLGHSFHVVASLCLLSQLIDSELRGSPIHFRERESLATEIVRNHLKSINVFLKPGGWGILVTDFVSSDTCPLLNDSFSDDWSEAVIHWLRSGNFFHGLHPRRLRQVLEQSDLFPVVRESVSMARPWKWSLGSRSYAVTALAFRAAL